MGQYFKSIYFSDFPSQKAKEKSITIAFKEPEIEYYHRVKDLTSEELRELIKINSYRQLELFSTKEERSINQVVVRLIKNNLEDHHRKVKRDVTFQNSKSIPFQRWYPFIEGYSPEFVKSLINSYCENVTCLYEPFAGTGTTIFAADQVNIKTYYSEVNPLLQFVIQTKIRILQSTPAKRKELSNQINEIASSIMQLILLYDQDIILKENYRKVFDESEYFEEKTFTQILRLRSYINDLRLQNELLADTLTVAVLSSLIPISLLKKNGDLRFKTKKELIKENILLEDFLPKKLNEIASDIQDFSISLQTKPELILTNAKNIDLVKDLQIDAVITSPPYLNGTNYFRNTKMELWFLYYIQDSNDLRYFRDQALTSGINDVKKNTSGNSTIDLFELSPLLQKTIASLTIHTYDQRIPLMAKSYFEEMYHLFARLRSHLVDNSSVLIDIGDSIFASVHVRTDDILIELFNNLGYSLKEKKLLRKRRSKNNAIISQTLLAFVYRKKKIEKKVKQILSKDTLKQWEEFKSELPHQFLPYSKRNWGHPLHSLCSYQGKLKAAIAHHLVKTFVPENGSIFDPFSGVGTIPFEASLNGRLSYGIDLSLPAYYISGAKVGIHNQGECFEYINLITDYINQNKCSKDELNEVKNFGFNKMLVDYYEESTLKEVILARRFIKLHSPQNPSQMLVVASLLHILHGNRPYALSRRSHPIVPYAPQGEFIYKSLIKSLLDKVNRTLQTELPFEFKAGKIYHQDTTSIWPNDINQLDAIITSPPFYDSTRFYLANWIRIWFSGWSKIDFKNQINSFIEEKQKKDFLIYESIFRQGRERLKNNGVFVLHLGKSYKCDMAEELGKVSKRWFRTVDLFTENVEHCESHGIRDKGTVTSHQYLILQ